MDRPRCWKCPTCGSELPFKVSPLPPYYPESESLGPVFQWCARHMPMSQMKVVA